ncbi:hypothetical protein BDF22DRAFT_730888 [Syncephalis plumigaleata]|nr:hypothetical protein BDF22DRAFT_730888 [Syncephalis plumigaleata]
MDVEMESDIAKAKRKNSKVNVEEANMDTNGAAEPDKKRRKQVLPPLADELVMLMNELKDAATHVVFEKKGKFPVELKTPLLNLPWLRKMVHRIVFPAQLRMLQLELEQTMQSFRDQIEATMRVQLALYEGLINAKTRDDISPAPANTNSNNNNNASMSDSQMEEGDGAGGNGELARKFRWTRDLRSQFWQIIDLREQIALKESQIQGLHTKAPDVKLQSIRKQVYADLIGLWPDGWMTTNLLSREYSAYKRLLAERAKNAASSPTVSFVPVIPNHLSSMDNRRGTSTNSPEPIELDRTELATSTNQQQQQHRHHQQHQFSTPPPPPLSSADNMQMDAHSLLAPVPDHQK